MTDYHIDQPGKRKQLRWGWFLFAILIVFAAVAGWHLTRSAQSAQSTPQPVQPKAPDLTSRLLIVGDVFWGRLVQRKAEASGKSYEYLMSGLAGNDRSTYDAWIANFECPITYRDVAYSSQVDNLKFNCRPEYLESLSHWFTAVTLANNHMDNNGGQQGLTETRQNLEKAGIQYTGNYDMTQTDDICEVVTLPAKVKNSDSSAYVPVALCGFMQVVNVMPTNEQLSVMEQYSRYMPVIALPHMGVEYRETAEPEKVAAYHAMIDHGADMVIGAHPHVIQNSERYHGKLIAYSVGNFLFDQQSLGKDTSVGLGVEVKLQIAGGKGSQAYQKLAANCQAYKDSCLQALSREIAVRPNVSFSYDFYCFDMTSGVPSAGSTATCTAAKQRATVSKLGDLVQ